MKRFVAGLLIMMMAVLAGCQNAGTARDAYASFQAVDTLPAQFSGALEEFSLGLFRRVSASKPGQNSLVSPLSLWLALGMARNGAAGNTAAAMDEALGTTGMALEDFNAQNAGLMGVLKNADAKATVEIANGLFLNQSYEKTVRQDFLQRCKDSYNGRAQALGFDGGEVQAINRWAKQATHGLIPEVVQSGQLQSDMVMWLLDALYFKAPWKEPFEQEYTGSGIFHTGGGQQREIEYMLHMGAHDGFLADDALGIRLPFASGRLQFLAVMPLQAPLEDYIAALQPGDLSKLSGRCVPMHQALRFPKFRMESTADLDDELRDMGMAVAFGDDADFSGIAVVPGLCLSTVRQDCVFQVDEQGGQGAAVSRVGVPAATSSSRLFVFDQPFFFWVQDSKTGAVLFLGAMEEPGAAAAR